jgi:hypothetical protein
MKEFALVFRNEAANEEKLTPADITALTEAWGNWMGGIASQGKLSPAGHRLGFEGIVVKPGNTIVKGVNVARGIQIIKADSIEGAAEIAKGCPILNIGGNVEVRDIIPMNN